MNLIEIAEDLKNVPDQYLMQEVQQPTGNYPAYLVVSELGRRKRMRDKVAKEMPTQTVAEELATPPAPPMMPQGMPQAGLMAMPQAQTELAAQDVMGTTPPEMMMPQMAGGGMVSFKQGGDVIRAFDGFPEEMYEDVSPPGRGIFPAIGDYFRGGFYNDITSLESLGYTPAQISQMTPEQRAEVARQVRTPVPAAVVPAAVTPAAAPAPRAAPSGAPARAPVAQTTTIPVQPAAGVPDALTPYALSTIGAQAASDYAQANPDRLTPFFQDMITKREGDIEKRRATNINDALIQAGLGAMRAKPKFRGSAGLFEVIGEGGQAGFDVLRQGRKDIRESEEAINAARAKMVESEMLRDERKFKAASDARKEAIELNNYGLNRAKTESAIALQNLQASKIPAEIGLLESQAYAYRNRPAGLDRTIATPDQIAQARIRAMTDLASVVKKPTQAQIDAAMDAILAESGLRRVGGGLTQLPAAIDRGTI
jgi:hypothetical protein